MFTRNMLPILGVSWHTFPTKAKALAFVRWAEKSTKHDEYPCTAHVAYHDDMRQWEVKVSNW